MKNENVSIVVPVYNEGPNLDILIPKIASILKKAKIGFEIIIVDDNSNDGTEKTVKKLIMPYNVNYILRKHERGLSSAVLKGFAEAKNNILGVIDGDLSHPPELIPELYKKIINGNEIVVASRYISGGDVYKFPFFRRMISKGAILIARLLTPIKDPMSGYFLIRKETIQDKKLNPLGYKILLEILVKGKYRNLKEIPYTFLPRNEGESKLKSNIYLEYIIHLLRLYKYKILGI